MYQWANLISLMLILVTSFKYAHGVFIEDQIKHLPGLNNIINFEHYSGYVEGNIGDNIHYWFVTSQHDKGTDPLVLWLNGGPGCSSMDGLLNELGPYLLNDDGETLKMNKHSWNLNANLLFLESPVCVGFSYRDDNNCQASDDNTSLTNYLALQSFFKKFPEFLSNPLFVTGESYGGIYIPTLAERIVRGLDKVQMNIKGFAVGNGLSSSKMNDDSLLFFGYFHGLIGTELWKSLIASCCIDGIPTAEKCDFSDPKSTKCWSNVINARASVYSGGLNMYNIYAKCMNGPLGNAYNVSTSRYNIDKNNLFQTKRFRNGKFGLLFTQLTLDPPCVDSSNMRKYLNSPEVKKAIHVKTDINKWDICNDEVNSNYKTQYASMREQYLYLTKHIRGLIYNGDVDMACNFLGDEWFADSLELKVNKERKYWQYNDQIGGYVKYFRNLSLVTVRGAGHMVPQDKPGPAFHMISSFLNDKPY